MEINGVLPGHHFFLSSFSLVDHFYASLAYALPAKQLQKLIIFDRFYTRKGKEERRRIENCEIAMLNRKSIDLSVCLIEKEEGERPRVLKSVAEEEDGGAKREEPMQAIKTLIECFSGYRVFDFLWAFIRYGPIQIKCRLDKRI